MTRRPDWLGRLAALLTAAGARLFDAHRWNCARFALAAVEAVTGTRPSVRVLLSLKDSADSAGFPASRPPSPALVMWCWPVIRSAPAWSRMAVARPAAPAAHRLHHRLEDRLMPAAIPLVAILAGGFASAAVGGGINGAVVAANVPGTFAA